ncbi:MAG: hypothetical protein DWQ49_10910 [Bacteroidetes bacterium]|nr:MAG: hypothetical protein DWQ49_10910 [Bacteroidota bacterium]|tara:strand:+ start:505 stop:903 length:399 start_codon:yes stop_codon:yes gene_type:complete
MNEEQKAELNKWFESCWAQVSDVESVTYQSLSKRFKEKLQDLDSWNDDTLIKTMRWTESICRECDEIVVGVGENEFEFDGARPVQLIEIRNLMAREYLIELTDKETMLWLACMSVLYTAEASVRFPKHEQEE